MANGCNLLHYRISGWADLYHARRSVDVEPGGPFWRNFPDLCACDFGKKINENNQKLVNNSRNNFAGADWNHLDLRTGELLLGLGVHVESQSYSVLENFLVSCNAAVDARDFSLLDGKAGESNFHRQAVPDIKHRCGLGNLHLWIGSNLSPLILLSIYSICNSNRFKYFV